MIETKSAILFFDTETTGILKDDNGNVQSNGSMIQLAYRIIENGGKIDENLFFNTDTEIEIGSIAVHGLYKDLLIEKSDNKYLNDDLRGKLGNTFSDKILVAHNMDFDKDVLNKENINYPDNLIDTLKVAKTMLSEEVLFNNNGKEAEYLNLQYLRYFFELYVIKDNEGNIENTTAHDAFGDVVVLENIFMCLFNIIKDRLKLSDNDVLDLMQRITKKEFILMKTMMIGKYRGKTFEEVYDIDSGYLEWITKNNFTEDIKYTCNYWLGHVDDEKFFS